MSKDFDMMNKEDKPVFCNSCTYEHSCGLLKYMNSRARINKAPAFNDNFYCNRYDKQPLRLDVE